MAILETINGKYKFSKTCKVHGGEI